MRLSQTILIIMTIYHDIIDIDGHERELRRLSYGWSGGRPSHLQLVRPAWYGSGGRGFESQTECLRRDRLALIFGFSKFANGNLLRRGVCSQMPTLAAAVQLQ